MSVTRHTLIDGKHVECAYDGKFDHECDVCVVGAGTAGAVAAISAARRGMDVLTVDLAPIPGGTGTAACVWDYYYGADGGLYEEVNAEADEILAGGNYIPSTVPDYKKSYPTAVKSLALVREFEKYHVRSIWSAFVTDVFTEDGKVIGVAASDGEKTITVRADVVIDGAEGAVCRLIGLKTLGGRRSDGKLARFSRTVGKMMNGHMYGIWSFNDDFAGKSPEESARLNLEWACRMPCLPDRMNEDRRLYSMGCEVGRREVLCVETEKVYTFLDLLEGRIPENPIFYTFAPLDNANPDLWNEDEEFQDWQMLCTLHASGISVGIPPECLIPKGTRGLLVAGKHIGTGHTMTSTVRMKTDMEKCGEAAGVMASMMTEHDCDAQTICRERFAELREILSETGCYNKENDRGVCDLNQPDNGMWKSVKLPETVDELRESLASIYPSLGLFAVRTVKGRGGDVEGFKNALVGWLDSDDKLLRENSAVALGLIGDKRALPELRRILEGKCETHTYRSPHKYFFGWLETTVLCNYVKAVCLIGRLGEREDDEILKRVAGYDGDEPELIKAREYAKAALKKR